MGVTPLTNAQLWKNHRIEVNIPIPTSGTGANVVEILREFDVETRTSRRSSPTRDGTARPRCGSTS